VGWLSLLMLVFLGAAVYPQAVQRIYAAPDGRTLERALQLMLLMPPVTTLIVVVIGILARHDFPAWTNSGASRSPCSCSRTWRLHHRTSDGC
jgi:hypothetical protein